MSLRDYTLPLQKELLCEYWIVVHMVSYGSKRTVSYTLWINMVGTCNAQKCHLAPFHQFDPCSCPLFFCTILMYPGSCFQVFVMPKVPLSKIKCLSHASLLFCFVFVLFLLFTILMYPWNCFWALVMSKCPLNKLNAFHLPSAQSSFVSLYIDLINTLHS